MKKSEEREKNTSAGIYRRLQEQHDSCALYEEQSWGILQISGGIFFLTSLFWWFLPLETLVYFYPTVMGAVFLYSVISFALMWYFQRRRKKFSKDMEKLSQEMKRDRLD